MKYLPLVWAGLWRKPMRTVFTLLSIMVAFILFGILSGIDAGFARMPEIDTKIRARLRSPDCAKGSSGCRLWVLVV